MHDFQDTITATAANVHEVTEVHKLIREDDEVVYGDSGYTGIQKRSEIKDDEHLSQVDYRIAIKPSLMKMKNKTGINWNKTIEHQKASVRSKVEHPYRIVKKNVWLCKGGISWHSKKFESLQYVVCQRKFTNVRKIQ